jgi:hypothetical protein
MLRKYLDHLFTTTKAINLLFMALFTALCGFYQYVLLLWLFLWPLHVFLLLTMVIYLLQSMSAHIYLLSQVHGYKRLVNPENPG